MATVDAELREDVRKMGGDEAVAHLDRLAHYEEMLTERLQATVKDVREQAQADPIIKGIEPEGAVAAMICEATSEVYATSVADFAHTSLITKKSSIGEAISMAIRSITTNIFEAMRVRSEDLSLDGVADLIKGIRS